MRLHIFSLAHSPKIVLEASLEIKVGKSGKSKNKTGIEKFSVDIAWIDILKIKEKSIL